MGENKHTPAEDPDRLVKSLVERAGIARSEGNATATADAWHFEQAAAEITRLRAENAGMREAARVFEDHYERGICHHESTHRGGAIWTICDDCGTQWADDQGGFKAFEYPPEIVAARAALEQEGSA